MTKHGMSVHENVHQLYRCWSSIKRRCTNKKAVDYKYYGGKGIKVCDEWANDFDAFWNWALANGYRQGLTIDRICNDGDYAPSNCRWATVRSQCRNRHSNHVLTFAGISNPAICWAEEKGINYSTLLWRINNGWPTWKALTQPCRKKNKTR